MSMRRTPQQERSHETQRNVVEGAAVVFDRVGYGSASLSMIAEQSGISQGAMYFHFKSKEQIALAVVHEQHNRSIPLMESIAQQSTSVFEQLVRVSRGVADQLLSDAVVRAGIRLAIEEGTLGEPAGGFYTVWVESTASLLETALTDGVLVSRLNSADLARALIGNFTGVQLMSQAISGRKDLLASLANMWLVLVDTIVPADERDAAVTLVHSVFDAA